MMIQPLLSAAGVERLREALSAAGYTSVGIAERIGPQAVAAMRRNDFRAALRATEDRDPLATLIRLFVCAQTEPPEAVAEALPNEAAPLLRSTAQGIQAAVDLEPYGDGWWVVSDLTGGPLAEDHVLGVGGASTTVAAAGTAEYTYRDSGRAGDAVCAELAAAAPSLLTEGGTMQYLANWLHVAGEDWTARVAGWVAGTGLDAWVIQREVTDPVSYVRLWQADAAQDATRTAAWLDWFDAHKVEAIGFGLVTLRHGGHADPTVRIEDLRQAVDQPLGEQVAAWFDRQDRLRGTHPLPGRYLVAPLVERGVLEVAEE